MGGRVRPALTASLATALPAALFGFWSVFLVLTGTGPGAQTSAVPVASAPAAAPRHLAAKQRATDGGPQSRPAEKVRRTAAVEDSVPPPGAAPDLPGGIATPYLAPPRGGETARPRHERTPPSGPHDPRHIRGPPSIRHS
ncbi:hypothetical protein AB0903_03600 [Streptomyces sp. NPDC048389]|uniref:hypothetical protein n=1 Tax=Streptomyces sp. NPDC048389 TaxID=3154622 RepID=UPI0034556C41